MTKLRRMLMEKGWTRQELANKSGVDRTIVYRYVNGTIKRPRDNVLSKFAKALNCNVELIMEDYLD